jgi:hypothetical protein
MGLIREHFRDALLKRMEYFHHEHIDDFDAFR